MERFLQVAGCELREAGVHGPRPENDKLYAAYYQGGP